MVFTIPTVFTEVLTAWHKHLVDFPSCTLISTTPIQSCADQWVWFDWGHLPVHPELKPWQNPLLNLLDAALPTPGHLPPQKPLLDHCCWRKSGSPLIWFKILMSVFSCRCRHCGKATLWAPRASWAKSILSLSPLGFQFCSCFGSSMEVFIQAFLIWPEPGCFAQHSGSSGAAGTGLFYVHSLCLLEAFL